MLPSLKSENFRISDDSPQRETWIQQSDELTLIDLELIYAIADLGDESV